MSYRGTVSFRREAFGLNQNPGDYLVVERGWPLLLVMRCPCGCGDDLLINLDKRAGPAWRFYQRQSGSTLYPSYWRTSACRSHFILWNDKIYWCSHTDQEDESYREIDRGVEQNILHALTNDYIHYIDLADKCGLTPWEALQACRQLEQKGLCGSGTKDLKGYFKQNKLT